MVERSATCPCRFASVSFRRWIVCEPMTSAIVSASRPLESAARTPSARASALARSPRTRVSSLEMSVNWRVAKFVVSPVGSRSDDDR
ncbi:hypothetical protein D3C87_1807950 [compost metagenome]